MSILHLKKVVGQDGGVATMEIDATLEITASPAWEKGEIEVGRVRETLDEILIEIDPSLFKSSPSNIVS